MIYKTQSQGVAGHYHSQKTKKWASVLGLSMVSSMADILTQKNVTPGRSEAVPKASLKNALYGGVSRVAEMESQRQTSQLNKLSPYVTVPIGTRLMVRLTSSLKGDFLDD